MPTIITDTTATWALAYDSLTRITDRRLSVGGADAFRDQLTWDKLDRLTKKIEIVKGITHTFDYTYDAGGRLIEVLLRDGC